MIRASETLKAFIRGQKSVEDFADEVNVSRQTLYNLLDNKSVSGKIVSKLLDKTGLDFESAFVSEGD